MRKILTALIIMLVAVFTNAQIVKEQTYDGAASITKLENDGYKYYVIDGTNNSCLLYNTDNTLWKEISIAVPDNNFIAEISFVSQHLFNDNDDIELLVIFARYDSTGPFNHYVYTTQVVDEAGNNLVTVDGGGFAFIKKSDEDKAKLFVYIYNLLESAYPVATDVYDIPGVPMSTDNQNAFNDISTGNPFPNPAGEYINIPYKLDTRDNTGFLRIFNEAGKEVRTFIVGKDFENIRILTSGLPEGVYFYTVQSEHSVSGGKKFFIE